MAKVPGTDLPGSRGSAAAQGRSRGRGLENGLLRTRRASRRRRGRRAREAPAGWLVSPSTSAARHVHFGPRLLAQFQKAARDIAAPTETGPEPRSRPSARGAVRTGAPPRRSGCGAVPPPLPGRGGRQRRRWRPGHGREEPLRSPGQPAAGRRGVPRRAAPRPARGAEPGECQCPAAEGLTRLRIEDGTFSRSKRETGAKNAGRPWPQGAVGVGSGCFDKSGVCEGRPASCSGTCGAAGWRRPALRKPGGNASARAPRGPARVAIWGVRLRWEDSSKAHPGRPLLPPFPA